MDEIEFETFETEIRENTFIRDEAYWTLHQCVKRGKVFTVRMLKMELFELSVLDFLLTKLIMISRMKEECFESLAGMLHKEKCQTHNGKGRKKNHPCAYAHPLKPYLQHEWGCIPITEKLLVVSNATPPVRSLASLLHVTDQLHLSWNQRIKIGYQISKTLNRIHAINDRVTIFPEFDRNFYIFGYGGLSSMYILVDDRVDVKLSLDPAICYAIERSVGDYYGEDPRDLDVYQFGIILLELVTGKEVNLRQVKVYMSKSISNLSCLLDPKLKLSEASHLDVVLTLAVRCVYEPPDRRPSMREVLEHMESIYQSILNTAALSTLNL